MTRMIFFAQPDSQEDQQQKVLLKNAGMILECKNILKQKWTKESLLPFVRGRDPLQIMNCKASDIRTGKIDPVLITFEKALELMVESPVLIKGPLVKVDNLFIQGTKDGRLNRYLLKKGKPQTNSHTGDTAENKTKSNWKWEVWQQDFQPTLNHAYV